VGTPKSYSQLVAEALRTIPSVTPAALQSRLEAGERIVVIDVREADEFARGKIPGAYTIPRGVLEGQVDGRLPREATVVLYCGAGRQEPGRDGLRQGREPRRRVPELGGRRAARGAVLSATASAEAVAGAW
jgi:hypothetical protein